MRAVSESITSRRSSMAEAGIEPASDFNATGKLPCGCVICENCRAALALHFGRPGWLELASADADLQRVVTAWTDLPDAIRRALIALVGSQ